MRWAQVLAMCGAHEQREHFLNRTASLSQLRTCRTACRSALMRLASLLSDGSLNFASETRFEMCVARPYSFCYTVAVFRMTARAVSWPTCTCTLGWAGTLERLISRSQSGSILLRSSVSITRA